MPTAGGVLQPGADTEFYGSLRATGPAATIGYGPTTTGLQGATGGLVTQQSNRTTGVTLNTICGTITTNTTSLGAELAAEFTVTNSLVAIGDVVVVSQQSGSNGGMTDVWVSTVAAGSFKIKVANNNAAAGTAETGAILINFAVIKSTTT
jgi:hypothetical protein